MKLVVVTIFLVAFVVLATTTPTLAFYPAHRLAHYASSPQELFSLAEPVDEKREKQKETPSILFVSEGSSSAMLQRTELWLDLRGTAMSPQTAISYLEQNLKDDVIAFDDEVDSGEGETTMQLDGIIVPEEYRGQLKEDSSPEVSYKVIFWDDKQQKLSSAESIDDSIGQVMIARPNQLLNPMEVMDALSNLPWAVIEKADDTEDVAFVEEIQSLFSVIHSVPSEHGGGTAVSCSNRAVLVEVAKIFALSHSHNCLGMTKTTTTTSSGILLPQSDDSWILGTVEGSIDETTQKIAVILPLEPELWRIAQDFLV